MALKENNQKMWGKDRPFWGLTSDYDPDWLLTEAQKKIREDLMDICRRKIRPQAIVCDKEYKFPRESLDALASLGLLGLIVPKEMGGLGENHVCAAMVTETIARYGCPSTAMVYTMHLACVSVLLFRYHRSPLIQDLLKTLDKDRKVGTLSYSDPATGGHFWFPVSSKAQYQDANTIKLLKYGSWATSAGCADFYAIQTVSPDFGRDFSNMSCFLVYKHEVRANTDDWSALGMHGNQSGPMVVEGCFSADRLIGPVGDGSKSSDECVDIFFLLCSSASWCGISMACLDLAKKHVTRKSHADVAMRVCDYPTIQDYFGDTVCHTNSARVFCLSIGQALDAVTDNNAWSKHQDLDYMPRSSLFHWLWQLKYMAAKTVTEVSDTMLHVCGGSGYKTDLGLERLLRDAKASWVMGPSNEVLRQFVGNTALLGMEAIDYWSRNVNERKIHHELGKMTLEEKKKLAQKLAEEVAMEESNKSVNHPYQDTDFENPFNTCPPYYSGNLLIRDGVSHQPALNPQKWTTLKLLDKSDVTEKMASFVFQLPNATDYTGLLAGQYMEIRVTVAGTHHTRFFSPVSPPEDFGRLELVMRFETSGIMSQHIRNMEIGDSMEFRGPSGGFEYQANRLARLTLIASGGGITPGLQIIRTVIADKADETNIKLVYYSDSYDDILYREELDSFAAGDSRLHIAHTLGEVPENWTGEEGFIDTSLLKRELPSLESRSESHKILICGGPSMAISCLHSLRTLDVPSQDIFIYGQFGSEQMRIVYGPKVRLSGHRSDAMA